MVCFIDFVRSIFSFDEDFSIPSELKALALGELGPFRWLRLAVRSAHKGKPHGSISVHEAIVDAFPKSVKGLTMLYPHIEHHGAAGGVTGCHQLHMDAYSGLLIDCGLFQRTEVSSGGRAGAVLLDINFRLAGVKALVATHVHIDHAGRLPWLLAAGFDGPIICSEPSARLLPFALEHVFRLGMNADQKQIERYIKPVEQRLQPLAYNQLFTLQESEQHVEIDLSYPASGEQKRIVFSGDLGVALAPLLTPPSSPERADVLVLESTCGDRLHEGRYDRRQRHQAVVEQAPADKGAVLIPAFSIGRTQELLYELEEIIHSQTQTPMEEATAVGNASVQLTPTNWPELPIILDSPLACRFTEAHRKLQPCWNRERVDAGRGPLDFDNLLTIDSHADHIAVVNHLTQTARADIVIAGGGTCSGGRIVNNLKAMLGDKRHSFLFVGYRDKDTPGQIIQQYGSKGGYVELDGERYDIRAGITSIGGYSAHADQKGLFDFVTEMKEAPTEIRLVHGEQRAKRAVAKRLGVVDVLSSSRIENMETFSDTVHRSFQLWK